MQNTSNKLQSGFTMVELMVALVLSMTLSVAVVSVFVNNSHSFKQDDNIARMQDDARHALREIAFDLSMAGHYAELHMPDVVTLDGALGIGVDCGPAGEVNWTYRTVVPGTDNSLSITAVDNASNADAAAAYSCIAAGELLEGTDIVSIKRVVGSPSNVLRDGGIYLRTNGTVGLLFRAPAPAAPAINVALPRSDWEFRPSIYFIRQFANNPGDGIPTLCRKILNGVGPSMVTECLATGIENLQIEYGIDTNEDGAPDTYMPSPTLAQMQTVVTARVFILARTTDIDTRYDNDKTYSISNSPDFLPDDSFHRRVYSTNVTIQNIRSMNKMSL
jgi:prepilin-type N-terminal cleavage/methylation domain-containing protein